MDAFPNLFICMESHFSIGKAIISNGSGGKDNGMVYPLYRSAGASIQAG